MRDTAAPGLLEGTQVREAMTTELVTCTPDMPLHEVAALMARHRIHSVLVPTEPVGGSSAGARWSVLSDLDLVAAAPWRDQTDAGSVAASPRVAVRSDLPLAAAALTMAEYATAHVLVVDGGDGEPVGILSALDVARVLAQDAATDAPPPPASGKHAVVPGDRLVIVAHQQGGRPRDAEVLEARGDGGGPPYLVRWQDTGRVSLHYPGSDAVVKPLAGAPRRPRGVEG